MDATRRSIVAALVGVALAACKNAKVDDAPPLATTFVVRVRLSPEPRFRLPLYASLHRIDDPTVGRYRVAAARTPFSDDLVATLTAPRPGRYAVELDVEMEESDIGAPGVLGSGVARTTWWRMSTIPADPVVTVGDDGAPVEVVVGVVPSGFR